MLSPKALSNPIRIPPIPANKSIDLTINAFTRKPDMAMAKRKVAAYARVSTDSDEQFTSYEAQIQYYTDYINDHADWELVEVYPDEGISDLSTKKRENFQRMIVFQVITTLAIVFCMLCFLFISLSISIVGIFVRSS